MRLIATTTPKLTIVLILNIAQSSFWAFEAIELAIQKMPDLPLQMLRIGIIKRMTKLLCTRLESRQK
jgi:hypothetical protein